MSDEEFERYTTNRTQVIKVMERNRQAWIAFIRDPDGEGLDQAYLADLSDPILTRAIGVVRRYQTEGLFTEPGEIERRFVVLPDSVSFNDDYLWASAVLCEVNSELAFQRGADGEVVLLDDDVVTIHLQFDLRLMDGDWKITELERIREEAGDVGC